MLKVCFMLILQGFFASCAPETCVFGDRKPVWNVLVVHTGEIRENAQVPNVENMGRNRKNFLLGCGQTVEKKISAVYCVKNTYPQDVCKSVDNLA